MGAFLSAMEVVALEEKDAGDWVYRGEGAANIVLSYTGSSPLFAHKELVLAPTKEIATHLYIQHVMIPLLGDKHVNAGIQVHVSKEFLEEIKKNVKSFCPSCRINVSEVDILSKSVLLISDHSLFPEGNPKGDICISVEIKIEDVRNYDPLDLFSGSKERICQALKALFDNLQNNLSVFLNGSLVLGGLGGIGGTTTAKQWKIC